MLLCGVACHHRGEYISRIFSYFSRTTSRFNTEVVRPLCVDVINGRSRRHVTTLANPSVFVISRSIHAIYLPRGSSYQRSHSPLDWKCGNCSMVVTIEIQYTVLSKCRMGKSFRWDWSVPCMLIAYTYFDVFNANLQSSQLQKLSNEDNCCVRTVQLALVRMITSITSGDYMAQCASALYGMCRCAWDEMTYRKPGQN